MPLPPALAARLAKRGIIPQEEEKKEEVEEVFVEHYDEETNEQKVSFPSEPEIPSQALPDIPEPPSIKQLVHEKRACPNQSNPYHTCSHFCVRKWGYCRFEPDPDMERKKERMLRKHPLPDNWLEIGDPVSHRYYYWNTDTDEVSWLPPTHPRSVITQSAEKIQALSRIAGGSLGDSAGESDENEEEDDDDVRSRSRSRSRSLSRSRSRSGSFSHSRSRSRSPSQSDSEMSDQKEYDMDDFEALEQEILREKQKKEERSRGRRERKKQEEPLDPMDPASYSDIPRGKWSDGLTVEGSKTGVDSTASGPLFQQRPYPSPGDILRMNQGKK